MPVDYQKQWVELQTELMEFTARRTTLETELSEVNTAIAHLEKILDHLQPLAGIVDDNGISALGITEAIRRVLKGAKTPMSAQDIRRTLESKSFDLSGLTAPMASIYKILSRLVEDSGEAEREKDENGRVFYRWKANDSGESTEITDDGIPF